MASKIKRKGVSPVSGRYRIVRLWMKSKRDATALRRKIEKLFSLENKGLIENFVGGDIFAVYSSSSPGSDIVVESSGVLVKIFVHYPYPVK